MGISRDEFKVINEKNMDMISELALICDSALSFKSKVIYSLTQPKKDRDKIISEMVQNLETPYINKNHLEALELLKDEKVSTIFLNDMGIKKLSDRV